MIEFITNQNLVHGIRPIYALLCEENSVKLLGLFIDSDLPFHGHIKVISNKASQKVSAIARLANVISNHKKRLYHITYSR